MWGLRSPQGRKRSSALSPPATHGEREARVPVAQRSLRQSRQTQRAKLAKLISPALPRENQPSGSAQPLARRRPAGAGALAARVLPSFVSLLSLRAQPPPTPGRWAAARAAPPAAPRGPSLRSLAVGQQPRPTLSVRGGSPPDAPTHRWDWPHAGPTLRQLAARRRDFTANANARHWIGGGRGFVGPAAPAL